MIELQNRFSESKVEHFMFNSSMFQVVNRTVYEVYRDILSFFEYFIWLFWSLKTLYISRQQGAQLVYPSKDFHTSTREMHQTFKY